MTQPFNFESSEKVTHRGTNGSASTTNLAEAAHCEDPLKKGSFVMIRTSARRKFRRCLRAWGFASGLRQNLERNAVGESNINFWFGSAIHFALEDYHGWNKFGDPRRAYIAYNNAFKPDEKPMAADSVYDLGMGMLEYYLAWLPMKNEFRKIETVWCDENFVEKLPYEEGAMPMVEVSFTIPMGIYAVMDAETGVLYGEKESMMLHHNFLLVDEEAGTYRCEVKHDFPSAADGQLVVFKEVGYHGTVDRIVKDRDGKFWILDYKTAKGADTNKLETDDQIDAYLWALEKYLGIKFEGFVYLQLTKSLPKEPKIIKGGHVSTDKKQATTYRLYKDALVNVYGSLTKAPVAAIETLNVLADKDTPEGDAFVRWDFVKRKPGRIASTEEEIRGEIMLMLQPDLYLFPAPTRDCIWDCSFRDVCLHIKDGEFFDAETILREEWKVRDGDESNHDPWRTNIVWPEGPMDPPDEEELQRLRPRDGFEIIIPDSFDE